METYIFGILEEKINEVFAEIQEHFGINNGDISPLDEYELMEKERELTVAIGKVIRQQMINTTSDDTSIYFPTKEELTVEDDVWIGLAMSELGYAVDYNYYINEEEQCSMLYPCYMDKDGHFEIDTSTSREYNIDFSNINWKNELIKEALDFLNEIIKEDLRKRGI